MMSTRFVLVITVWSYQCLPDFLMAAVSKPHKVNRALVPLCRFRRPRFVQSKFVSILYIYIVFATCLLYTSFPLPTE